MVPHKGDQRRFIVMNYILTNWTTHSKLVNSKKYIAYKAWNHEEAEKMNRLIRSTEIDSLIKCYFKKEIKTQSLGTSLTKCSQY